MPEEQLPPRLFGTSLLDGTDYRAAEGLLVVLSVQGRSMRTTPSLQGESFMSKGCFWFISFGYRVPSFATADGGGGRE